MSEEVSKPIGRPPAWKTPEELRDQGMAWIQERLEAKLPLTVTGLALALKTSRETLMNYEAKDEFFDTVKELKSYCENYAEEQAFIGKNAAGAIFALKNYGWRDKQELDHTSGGEKLQVNVVNFKGE